MFSMYVNWDERVILNEEQFYNKIMAITEEKVKDSGWIDSFLSENYSPYEIFNFTDKEKEEITEEMWNESEEETTNELLFAEWEKIEVES